VEGEFWGQTILWTGPGTARVHICVVLFWLQRTVAFVTGGYETISQVSPPISNFNTPSSTIGDILSATNTPPNLKNHRTTLFKVLGVVDDARCIPQRPRDAASSRGLYEP
jgi:hypothetical protein